MNKKLLEKIKTSLISEREELLKRNYSSDIDIDGDETDEIQGKILATVNTQLSNRDNLRLDKIKIALKKIDNGDFGDCDECGEEISEKRIMINHCFFNCISCAEQIEINKKKGLL